MLLLIDVFVGRAPRRTHRDPHAGRAGGGAALTSAYAHVSERTVLFEGMYVADRLAFVLKLAGFLFVAVALLYSRSYLEQSRTSCAASTTCWR